MRFLILTISILGHLHHKHSHTLRLICSAQFYSMSGCVTQMIGTAVGWWKWYRSLGYVCEILEFLESKLIFRLKYITV